VTTTIHQGDCRRMTAIADGSIHCVATSPPYWGLRSYLAKDDPAKASEIGAEPTPDGYVASMVAVGREVRRVLREDGSWWLNLGDGYSANRTYQAPSTKGGPRHSAAQGFEGSAMSAESIGLPPKSLLLMPFRVALALQADGWILRAAIPWVKHGTCMPESVQDRPTTAHETVFLLARSERYYFDADAVRVGAQIRTESDAPIRRQTEGGTDRRRMGGGNDGLGVNPAGRNIRTSDFHAASLDALDAYLVHVRHVRAAGGLLLTPEGEPSAFLVNPVPSPYKHFAMWPPALVKPMILASTSERGCCPVCGAGWRRVVDVSGETARDKLKARGASAYAESQPKNAQGLDYAGSHGANARQRSPRGWQQSCLCPPSPPIPCTVLDPFAGTSTTLRVADDLGRHAIGYELNAAYLPIAAERTAQQGLFAAAAASHGKDPLL